ncbi:hypothetical protein [Agrobacterium vitis]|uniref:Uncharacterized protein n=1 Tax=Agrobacterium vitis TaxID=373 RepID=A0AAE2R989_AGRVI|nr:hypothetical protein [Agrobacterium vitis]MBF2713998.1 hypothetical protein [Agrobacterium vitis]MUZ62024.1 hypothetical protein [Agrobacterium vitis]MVA20482.1 hypothetical protein [Agrobacterium vitis]
MELIGTLVHPEKGGRSGYNVEFVSDSGDVVSVQLKQSEGRSLTRENAPEAARSLLEEISTKEVVEGGTRHADQARRDEGDRDLNDALEDTFPASDPVSMATTSTIGGTGNNDN